MVRVRAVGLSRSERRNIVVGLLFASPFILGFLAFTLYPVAMSLYYSFNHYGGIDPPRWIGLNNYRYMLQQDDQFRQALGNTIYMVVFDVPAELITAFLMAILLNAKIRGQTIYRSFYILPAFMPLVPVAVLWMWLFDPNFGVVDGFLGFLHLPQPLWLADPSWSKPTLILLNMWTVGTTTIIYLAALQGVPETLYEAAALDGAGRLRQLWHVTVPMISAATFFNLITTMIAVFQIFTEAYLLGGSSGNQSTAPIGNPQGSMLFFVLYLWSSAFNYLRFGYASALAWLLFVIILGCTAAMLYGSRRWVYYESEAA